MKIRTRHKVFKALIFLAVVNYLVFLYDILLNSSAWFIWVMLAFVALIVVTLLFYIGVKPDLEEGDVVAGATVDAEDEEPFGELPPAEDGFEAPLPPATPDEAVQVVEIPKPHAHVDPSKIRGPQHFRCPFCSYVFMVEATHLKNRRDVRMSCPYCTNHVRIPGRARIIVGPVPHGHVSDSDRIAYHCTNCGEVVRVSAPASRVRRLTLSSCPHCGSSRLTRATVGA